MGKGQSNNKSSQKYLSERKRIKNKTRKLEKRVKVLELGRKEEVINPNTKLPITRNPIENIVKNSRIGRKKEGFSMEEFKKKPSKKSHLSLGK
uniref:Uncharacterized protein n=1 Tax=viral metagenome TaxID=1070528 RepID=A0A6M3KF05_9ZZZZ